MVKVIFTPAQLREAQHKARILSEDEDMFNSYPMSREEVESTADILLRALPGCTVSLSVDYCYFLAEEFETMIDAEKAAIEDGDTSAIGEIRALRQGITKLRNAAKGAA